MSKPPKPPEQREQREFPKAIEIDGVRLQFTGTKKFSKGSQVKYHLIFEGEKPVTVEPVAVVPVTTATRTRGPSGEACPYCGSIHTQRSGTCLTCRECLRTTGCS